MSDLISCVKCGYCEDQSKIHLHHLVPITLGGTDLHGRRYLCKKCHDILHNMLITRIWKFVPDESKEDGRNSVKSFSLWWIKQ